MNLDELKINDQVGYERTHNGTFVEKGFGFVSNINDHGHITIVLCGAGGCKVFDEYGVERGKRSNATRLCSAESLSRRLAEVKANKVYQRAIQDLLDHIAGCPGDVGQYVIDESSKDKIKQWAVQL